MTKYAVVDVETTGFGKTDRVVELAVVVIDLAAGEVVDEFETLLNPMRDIGAIHVHGVTATMVEAAPTFDEIAPTLTRVLGGNVLVAHNLPFDRRFLLQEFARSGIDVDTGQGVCTLRLAGERLDLACQRYGIAQEDAHRAMADARATAQLLATIAESPGGTPFQVHTDVSPGVPRTLRRPEVSPPKDVVSPSRFRVRYPSSDELEMSYLHVLDAYLDDLVLTDAERLSLAELASLYGVSRSRQNDLHRAYLTSLIAAAQRDGFISQAEHALVTSVSAALQLDDAPIPPATPVASIGVPEGARVCFTGKAQLSGQTWERTDLEALAAQHGLQPVASVGKSCDLLVAADPASTSGKAQKARQLGVPIVSIDEFLARLQGN